MTVLLKNDWITDIIALYILLLSEDAVSVNSFADRLGPVRNGGRGSQRDNGRQAAGRNAPAKREKRKPVTAADLDAELEAFMNRPSNAPSAQEAQSVKAPADAQQDVEMS